jgi:hypothetical protein
MSARISASPAPNPGPDYAAKMIIDATRPLDVSFPERLRAADWIET